MPGQMNHRLESRLPGKISTTSDVKMIPPLIVESEERGSKEPLDDDEKGE